VAPGRKVDPGEKFDWARLARAGIGHWVEPAPIAPGPAFDLGEVGEEVRALQRALADYGYDVETSGLFEPATKSVVRAFQLHFRQGLVDGVADVSTRDTLARLGANA
jgi:N-acetylmuramoyl-L-alanine amidase